MIKDYLRKQMHDKRMSLSKQEVSSFSEDLFQRFLKSDLVNYTSYMVYLPIKNEADTMLLIKYLLDNNKKVCVPHINVQKILVPVEISKNLTLVQESFGVAVPKDKILFDPQKLDVIFTPGLAFDKKGHRVGYGKGYYDRFLSNITCITCAWCYDFQIVENISDINEYDVAIKRFLEKDS